VQIRKEEGGRKSRTHTPPALSFMKLRPLLAALALYSVIDMSSAMDALASAKNVITGGGACHSKTKKDECLAQRGLGLGVVYFDCAWCISRETATSKGRTEGQMTCTRVDHVSRVCWNEKNLDGVSGATTPELLEYIAELEGSEKRPVGAPCTVPEECVSERCLEDVCQEELSWDEGREIDDQTLDWDGNPMEGVVPLQLGQRRRRKKTPWATTRNYRFRSKKGAEGRLGGSEV
jgi:hypothetical protein